MSDSQPRSSGNRRGARTRGALREAYNNLVLRDRRRDIKVADIVAEARVGRSTFYDHFDSADDLYLEALAKPMAILADAAAGQGDQTKLTNLLEHFWENRQRARTSFADHLRDRVTGLVAELVEARIDGERLNLPPALASLQLAEAALAPVRGWVMARAPCSAEALAASLCASGRNLAAALRESA